MVVGLGTPGGIRHLVLEGPRLSSVNGEWRAPKGFGVGPSEWEHAPAESLEQGSSVAGCEEEIGLDAAAGPVRRSWRPLVTRWPRRER
jgi:hypothetical protein